MGQSAAIVLFRYDLRLHDHWPLLTAAKKYSRILPLYCLEDRNHRWDMGDASRWWLHHSLVALDGDLKGLGSDGLCVVHGPLIPKVVAVAKAYQAKAFYCHKSVEPKDRADEHGLIEALKPLGITPEFAEGQTLFPCNALQSSQGRPPLVYGAFRRRALTLSVPPPVPAPSKLPPWPSATAFAEGIPEAVKPLPPSEFGLLPQKFWYGGLEKSWKPGEINALSRAKAFLGQKVGSYADRRDRPDIDATSTLSPYLRFGEVSPRWVWHQLTHVRGLSDDIWQRQILWREFSYHLLAWREDLPDVPLRPEFLHFPWKRKGALFKAWATGKTGYPIVDAGMAQLWQTGWMHNRVRMIVASFLVKHLGVHWLDGAQWFWNTLVDADLANNTMGWQWVAGCGADSAPYFRIFNPILQGLKFDPEGHYVRKWLPALADVKGAVHDPSSRPLYNTVDYPPPVVTLEEGRRWALDAFEQCRAHATSRRSKRI